MNSEVDSGLFNRLVKQEKQLLEKKDDIDILGKLIDDDFYEIGSSSKIHDKQEVLRWLQIKDSYERVGMQYKARKVSEDVILLNYISVIKEHASATSQHAIRTSLWRRCEADWRLLFHQGTPIIK